VDTRAGEPGNHDQGLDGGVEHGHHIRALTTADGVPGRPSPSADPAASARSIRAAVAPTARTDGPYTVAPLRSMTASLALTPVVPGCHESDPRIGVLIQVGRE
jgi:hypothetical protein